MKIWLQITVMTFIAAKAFALTAEDVLLAKLLKAKNFQEVTRELTQWNDLEVLSAVCRRQIESRGIPWGCYQRNQLLEQLAPIPEQSARMITDICLKNVAIISEAEPLSVAVKQSHLLLNCRNAILDRLKILAYKSGKTIE